jgi:outer membrane protein
VTMNKSIVLALLMAVSSSVFAQGKIAVLDSRAAIMSTTVAQERIKKVQANPEFAADVKQMEKLRKEYEEMVKKVQKDSAVMSKDQQKTEIKKITKKREEIEKVGRKLQGVEQQVSQMLFQELGPKMQQVVNEIIKADGIGLLFNRESVVFFEPSYNITEKVTAKLNQAK